MSNKILIVGGTGFLGNALINKLARIRDNNITCVYSSKKKIINRKSKVKYLLCDISKLKNIKRKLNKNFDIVVNFAGYVDHKKKTKTVNSHFNGCKNLANHFSEKKLKLFIQIGSSLEYGKIKSPHKENVKCKPISHYGRAKYLATKYIQKNVKKYLILRPYQIYGPHQKKDRLIPIIIDGCLKDKSFECSDGSQFRDFLFVDDFSDLILKILKSKKISSGIYNIGSGKPHKVKDIINLIQKKIRKGKPLFGKLNMRKEEMVYSFPNIKKIQNSYKWKPKRNINFGLNKTIKFYEK